MVPTHFGHVRSWKVTNRKRATLTTGTRHLNIPNEVGLRQKAQRGRGEAFEVGHESMSKGNMVALSFVISEIVTATQKPVGLVS